MDNSTERKLQIIESIRSDMWADPTLDVRSAFLRHVLPGVTNTRFFNGLWKLLDKTSYIMFESLEFWYKPAADALYPEYDSMAHVDDDFGTTGVLTVLDAAEDWLKHEIMVRPLNRVEVYYATGYPRTSILRDIDRGVKFYAPLVPYERRLQPFNRS